MKSTRVALALFVAMSILAIAHSANAQGAYSFGGRYFNPYRGNAFGASPYALGRIPTPPYFALHPPVYYSGITPTTYGRRPFPQPAYPIFQAPQAQVKVSPSSAPTRSVRSLNVVQNPYMKSTDTPEKKPARTRTVKVILNPFYRPNSELAKVE